MRRCFSEHTIRRSGRVAEGAPLLREYTLIGIEGSNPSFSAIQIPPQGGFFMGGE
jgi:hypothetical protein